MLCISSYVPLPISPHVSFSSAFIVISGCMYPSHHWGDWNDSQLLPTIQKLMKGYNRYLRPNFNGTVIANDSFEPKAAVLYLLERLHIP